MEDYFNCNGGGGKQERVDISDTPTIMIKTMSEFRNSDAKKKRGLLFLFHLILHSGTEDNLDSEAGKRKKKGLSHLSRRRG